MVDFGKRTMGGLLLALAMLMLGQPVLAAASSVNVVIIGGSTLDLGVPCTGWGPEANNMGYTSGGCLNLGVAGLENMTFTAVLPSAVSAASLAQYDTAVLNVASSAMACNANTLSAQQQADLVAFVAAGKKLVIFDSECAPVNYGWMPYPFTTANPGAMGALGTLTIVEENTLSSNNPLDQYYINASYLSNHTDAVGDMNVMATYDPNWCVDMSGTNAIGKRGPVHTYAKYLAGTDTGLFLYNGLDQDYQGFGIGDPALTEIWVQELQQPFDPSNLPCGVTVVGITLEPPTATNYVGEDHAVTATLKDLLGNPQPGVLVDFAVVSGPNVGAGGSATTDANGQAGFTYAGNGGVGVDSIEACFTNQAGQVLCSQKVAKEWIVPPVGNISGTKFDDLNGNGAWDAGEPGLAGWAITLTDSGGNVITKATGEDGSYLFAGIAPGAYVVGESVQLGWVQTYPAGGVHKVNLAAGEAVIGKDFGNYKIEGRMTGGGSVFARDGTRVTHGFELDCDATDAPNNLQISWGKGNKFHLEGLKAAACVDDPAIEPNPPKAGFDNYFGMGTGRYNGVAGATAKWAFTDAGEPGKNDIANIEVRDAGGNLVLSVSGNLNSGNNQAHEE